MIFIKEILITLGVVAGLWLAGTIFGYGFACGLRAGELKFKVTIKNGEENEKGN